MAKATETKAAEKTTTEEKLVEEAPSTKGHGVVAWEGFQDELTQRAEDIANMLPRHISRERFMAVAVAAVKQNPDLLFADRRSLMGSITKAAQDGMMPDGREGVITVYNTNVAKRDEPAKWIKMCQWNPMVYGLRKRARETDGIIIDAQVVYDGDHFIWHQGDDPRIEHEPAKLGSDRGKMIGAYAIFKREDRTILHREVMDVSQIEATQGQSKAKNSLMWTTFKTEGWRKAVVRRGMKTVPVSEDLERIITRDDENFDFDRHAPTAVLAPPPAPPSAPPAQEPAPPTPPPAATGNAADDAYDDWRRDAYAELEACATGAAVEDMRDRLLGDFKDADKAAWKAACADKSTALFQSK